MQARWALAAAAAGGALLTAGALATSIRAGGVGKNGSTVAVSTPRPYLLSCSVLNVMWVVACIIVYLVRSTIRIVSRQMAGLRGSLWVCVATLCGQTYLAAQFSATFRMRGCGKNGSTVAVSSRAPGLRGGRCRCPNPRSHSVGSVLMACLFPPAVRCPPSAAAAGAPRER